nr:1,6-anhydro-N-acetylmuramyl-L-alanine amidase AmpD [Fastidiosibacter lacustris]
MTGLKLTADGWINIATKYHSPNYNDRPENTTISLLVIHCISLPEGCYDNDNVEYFFLNKLDCSQNSSFQTLQNMRVSSHFYIKRDGEILQFVSINKRAWHAGLSEYKGQTNCNDFSIGIELQGTDKTSFTDEQYQSIASLSKALIYVYPQIKGNVVGHQDIAPNRKTDPGVGFDWRRFMTSVLDPENDN